MESLYSETPRKFILNKQTNKQNIITAQFRYSTERESISMLRDCHGTLSTLVGHRSNRVTPQKQADDEATYILRRRLNDRLFLTRRIIKIANHILEFLNKNTEISRQN